MLPFTVMLDDYSLRVGGKDFVLMVTLQDFYLAVTDTLWVPTCLKETVSHQKGLSTFIIVRLYPYIIRIASSVSLFRHTHSQRTIF
jgi:hypothetical protein